MKTRLPFSTISYNSPAFLKTVLEQLRTGGIITFWCFIRHRAEDDEAGKRPHIHLWILPNRSVDTDEVLASFLEPDPAHPDKPLKCLSARSSKKFADWYLYAIHDSAYLLSKGQSRHYTYSSDDMLSSDPDDLHRFICEINMLDQSPYARMVSAMHEGITFGDYFRRGSVPIPQIRQFEYAWDMLCSGRTFRNGRKGHEHSIFKKVFHARRHYRFFIKNHKKICGA